MVGTTQPGSGQVKDETYIKTCETLKELKQEIKDYLLYYHRLNISMGPKKDDPCSIQRPPP